MVNLKDQKGSAAIFWIIVIGIAIWFFFLRGDKSSSYESSYSGGSSYSDESDSGRYCSEPENPYGYGSGHYAGFEWAENNDPGYCDGNSSSFNEGCEDYLSQQEEYDSCLSQ